jgi:hypothetical protein
MNRIIKTLALLSFSILITGCGGRDISSVDTALIGHWKVTAGEENWIGNEYYISEDQFISVNDGEEERYTYDILQKNDDKGTITIQASKVDGSGFEYRITFGNDDKTKLENTLNARNFQWGDNLTDDEKEFLRGIADQMDLKIITTWEYIDDKQEP